MTGEIMRQGQAREQILKIWLAKPIEERTENKAALFAMELTVKKSPLASFRCSGDPYQYIKGWLMPHTKEHDPLYGLLQEKHD